jgi:hypothetical protein
MAIHTANPSIQSTQNTHAAAEQALSGANPTRVITGLKSVTGFSATIKRNTAPGDGTSVLTYDVNTQEPGTVLVYAWTNTGGTDPTLVASSGTETFGWVAAGTI